MVNSAFEPDSDSDEGIYGDDVEVDRSHIQRLEVYTSASYCRFRGSILRVDFFLVLLDIIRCFRC